MLSAGLLLVAHDARGDRDRHPPRFSPADKPAGVPSDYVLTHNGFFHPSCVVTVESDEIVGGDGVIRGMDGAEHARFAPCAFPRYSPRGRRMDAAGPTSATPHRPPLEAAPVAYDGYIVWYTYTGSIAPGSGLSTQWTVPLAPLATANQDIAFFNDITTTAGGEDILQPVLDYNGESANHWAIESEHCCINNDDMQTTPIDVNAGDLILGTVTGSGCDSTGACTGWTVVTTDETTEKSTTLNTTAPMGVPNGVSPGSLETYGVNACDLFPANGEIAFVDNTLTSADGGIENVKYDFISLQGVNAELPTNCGYGGSESGNTFTLIFGAAADAGAGDASGPSGGQGGVVDAGTRDAAAGPLDGGRGSGAADASAKTGMDSGSGSLNGADAATTDGSATTGSRGTTSVDAAIADGSGTTGPGNTTGVDGATTGPVGAGGPALDGGTAGVADAEEPGSTNGFTGAETGSGCSCTVAARGESAASPVAMGLFALLGIARGRRRGRPNGKMRDSASA
jgi:MYXO-CTERM domain-containing protein